MFPPLGWFSRCLVTVTKREQHGPCFTCYTPALVVFAVYVYCLSFKLLDTSLVHKNYHWLMTAILKFRGLGSLHTAVWEPQQSTLVLLLFVRQEGVENWCLCSLFCCQLFCGRLPFPVTLRSLVVPVSRAAQRCSSKPPSFLASAHEPRWRLSPLLWD